MNKKLVSWKRNLIGLLSGWFVVVISLTAPATATAQYYDSRVQRIQDAILGYGTSIYAPYSYPGRLDYRDLYGRRLPPIEVEVCDYAECAGRKGTFHAEKGELHFRPYDSTHNPAVERHKDCLVIHSLQKHNSRSMTRMPTRPIPQSEVSKPSSETASQTYEESQDCILFGKLEAINGSSLPMELRNEQGTVIAKLPSPEGANSVCVPADGTYEGWAKGFVQQREKGKTVYGKAVVRAIQLEAQVQPGSITFNAPKAR